MTDATAVNVYDIGDLVILKATFLVEETPTDPSTVTFRLLRPDKTKLVYVYETDDELTQLSEGVYEVEIPITKSGTWIYRFEGTGDAVAAEEASFNVRKSKIIVG